MPKLPVISGEKLIKVFIGLGYTKVRQKGSHVRLKKQTNLGEHNITVPLHKELAKGTLNDIILNVAQWNGLSMDEIIKKL